MLNCPTPPLCVQLLAPKYFLKWKQRHQLKYHFAPTGLQVCWLEWSASCAGQVLLMLWKFSRPAQGLMPAEVPGRLPLPCSWTTRHPTPRACKSWSAGHGCSPGQTAPGCAPSGWAARRRRLRLPRKQHKRRAVQGRNELCSPAWMCNACATTWASIINLQWGQHERRRCACTAGRWVPPATRQHRHRAPAPASIALSRAWHRIKRPCSNVPLGLRAGGSRAALRRCRGWPGLQQRIPGNAGGV